MLRRICRFPKWPAICSTRPNRYRGSTATPCPAASVTGLRTSISTPYASPSQLPSHTNSVPTRLPAPPLLLQLHAQQHQAHAAAGLLTTTKLDKTIVAASVPIALAPPNADGVVRVGDTVMLSSPLEVTATLAASAVTLTHAATALATCAHPSPPSVPPPQQPRIVY